MALEQIAEDYFSKLNPIARRMYEDMKETKRAYEDLWESISEKEQKEILSDSIITPQALLKYNQSEIDDNIKEFAMKLVIDDHCSYVDEHSGPFTFKTRSQRNLNLFEREETQHKRVLKPKTKTKPMKVVERFVDDVQDFAQDNESNGNTLPKTGLDFLDNW